MRNISDVGVGHVGLSLAYELAKLYSVIGPDINSQRSNKRGNCIGITKEMTDEHLHSTKLKCSDRLGTKKWMLTV